MAGETRFPWGGHYRVECKHGVVITQCRCMGNKKVSVKDCPPSCTADDDE